VIEYCYLWRVGNCVAVRLQSAHMVGFCVRRRCAGFGTASLSLPRELFKAAPPRIVTSRNVHLRQTPIPTTVDHSTVHDLDMADLGRKDGGGRTIPEQRSSGSLDSALNATAGIAIACGSRLLIVLSGFRNP